MPNARTKRNQDPSASSDQAPPPAGPPLEPDAVEEALEAVGALEEIEAAGDSLAAPMTPVTTPPPHGSDDPVTEGLEYRRRFRGLIGVRSKVPIRDRAILSLVYTPGVAEACLAIEQDPLASYDLTCRGNTVAILTDGSDLFGSQGGTGAEALPIEEGKSVLFKTFAGIDAFPICLESHDLNRAIQAGVAIAPTFGAICLDDIAAPAAFTIADHLEKAADIPVFSNQHHGTAVLVLGGLINALKVTGREAATTRIVISGAGVAGIGVARLLVRSGFRDVVVCDRAGAIHRYRSERMHWAKSYVAKETNLDDRRGSLREMLKGADVFVGLSTGGIVDGDMIASMAADPIVFSLAVPDPEIAPTLARDAGARVVATSRSDFANQMDISLVFPGVFRGLLDSRARNIRLRTLRYAAEALADMVQPDELHADFIVPRIFDFRVAPAVAEAVARAAVESGEAGRQVDPGEVSARTRRFVYEGKFQSLPRRTNGEQRTFKEESIELRRRHGGVLEIESKLPIRDHHILNMVYVPPAAYTPAQIIRETPSEITNLTSKGNLVAIVTDGSAVLGLGDIGPQASLPVMEGKAVLFRSLAGVEAFPICLMAREVDEIVDIVASISPSFGGINLEDIAAPRCFEIERKLRDRLALPVFHDDQHGTAIVVSAGVINGLKLRGTAIGDARITINGAGAAGVAVAKLLLAFGAGDVILCDRAGALYEGRTANMDDSKREIARITNRANLTGSLTDALVGADIFIGLSAPGVLTPEMIGRMADRPLVFALANPTPEIYPDEARKAGALAVATGRSDFPNQINNSLAFPGVFRGALDIEARTVNDEMKMAAAEAIANLVASSELSADFLIPDSLDLRVPPRVASAVAQAGIATGVHRLDVDPATIEARARDLVYE